MYRKKILIKLLVVVFVSIVAKGYGQYKFQHVLEGLSGDELMTRLVQDYKPNTVLDYAHARDTLYGRIYLENDTVYGVYTRYGLYLRPNTDPSTYLYKDGTGINAEHTYPRSKGASAGNAKSDMHHIFPAKVSVNEKRGSLPFNEIDDNLTNDWYYKNIVLHHIPSTNIDAYSERMPQYFEPREDHKGNVARAMFYFYTMYRSEADAADNKYFEKQRKVLCQWHFADPVDSMEWERTWLIAKYQDNKPNPFVLDCSLASRTYCDFISDACKLADAKDITYYEKLYVNIYPVPTGDILNVEFVNPGMNNAYFSIYNTLGQIVYEKDYKLTGNEMENMSINISDLQKGTYILNIKAAYNKQLFNMHKLFIVK